MQAISETTRYESLRAESSLLCARELCEGCSRTRAARREHRPYRRASFSKALIRHAQSFSKRKAARCRASPRRVRRVPLQEEALQDALRLLASGFAEKSRCGGRRTLRRSNVESKSVSISARRHRARFDLRSVDYKPSRLEGNNPPCTGGLLDWPKIEGSSPYRKSRKLN